jgi:mannuronan 5-epimerase
MARDGVRRLVSVRRSVHLLVGIGLLVSLAPGAEASRRPSLIASPASLSFSMTEGGQQPAAQTAVVSNLSGGSVKWTVRSGAAWLPVTATLDGSRATLSVRVSGVDLASGTYRSAVTVTAEARRSSTISIPVTLKITASPPPSPPPPPPPPPAGDDVAVKDTSYPPPSGALFVAPWGNDAGAGTSAGPFRTITRAVQAAPAGATVVIRGGHYREAVPTFSKPLTLQPYPHEQVWMKGSLVVTGWVADGGIWRRDGWTTRFCHGCYPSGAIDPAYPTAGLPDMVFRDGRPLVQVTSRSAVGPGRFFVDYATAQLYIGSDPAGHTIEASVHSHALRIATTGRGTIVRGLGFAHYAPYANHDQGGMVFANTDRLTFENNTFAWSAAKGMVVYGANGVVRGNTFVNNGLAGLGMFRGDGAVVEGNRFVGNNQERFVPSGGVADAAGAKITRSRRVVIRDNVFERNLGNGLWLDVSMYDVRIVRNLVRDNARTGISYEISSRGIIASNVIARNLTGISISNSNDVRVFNNTLSRNATNLRVQDDDRVNTDAAELALGITWVTDDVTFVNNLLSGNDGSPSSFLWVRDYNSSPLKSADAMLITSDHNGLYRPSRSVPGALVEWWRGTSRSLYPALGTYQAGTGRDENSFIVEGTALNPFFEDEAADDYALMAASQARGRGAPLPADVAEAIGVPPLSAPDLGALLAPGGVALAP